MERSKHRPRTLIGIFLLGSVTFARAQGDCLTEFQYPFSAIVPNSDGTVTEISSCNYEEEHSRITGIIAGAPYEFTLSSGGYITVRQGTYDSPVLAQGYSPVQVTAVDGTDLFAHWTVDEQCSTMDECVTTAVQLILDCTPPAATATFTEDCDQHTFLVTVDVASTGDGSVVNVVYGVSGNVQSVPGVGIGSYELGPFPFGDEVTVAVEHESDPLCNVSLGTFMASGSCPNPITCGAPPLQETYCYQPNDTRTWTYFSVGTGTLRLTFLRGTIESSNYDHLRIYDGMDATGTLVFDHDAFDVYNLGMAGSAINNMFPNYYALQIYSTTGSLHMQVTSDGSVQCGGEFPDTSFDPWEWEVVCLDCEVPQVGIGISEDCVNGEFLVNVNVISTGSGATVDLVYTLNGGAPVAVEGVGTGETSLGPFALDDIVNIVVVHENNPLCNMPLGNITDSGTCPVFVDCGTEENVTYCHGDDENAVFHYQGTGTFPLALFFNSGSLEDCCDRLYVYDGPDLASPELTPPGGAFGDLTGQYYISTNPGHFLTVLVETDGSISCSSGDYVALDYTLDCLDCMPPTATFAIVQDCDNLQYFVDVTVSDLGTDPDPEITNNAGSPSITITTAGTYQIGPFIAGTPVQITVANDANDLCNVHSGTLVNPLCPTVLCGSTPLVQTYCYTNYDDHDWAYITPDGTGAIRLKFVRGTIESGNYDHLSIYDGPDASGALLFTHSNFQQYNLGPQGSALNSMGAPYYSVDVTAASGSIYMVVTTDISVSCSDQTGSYDPWEFQVECIGCSAPGIAYNVVPDCFHREYVAEVVVTEPPSAYGLTITNTITGEVWSASDVGTLDFGPYGVDSISLFSIVDGSSPSCVWMSAPITHPSDSCHIVSCGFDNYQYCYGDNEDRWYTYRSAQPVPTTITFLQGQMLTGDRIVVYNGPDGNSSVIYQGNNAGNLTGFAVNSQNPGHIITLRIQSNGSGSCADGQASVDLRWFVGCGAVGVEEIAADGFAVHPNPTGGTLYISAGRSINGMVKVRVLDMSGRTVMEQPLNMAAGGTASIELSGLQSGQYGVQFTTEHWTSTQRVQVAR